MARTSPAMTKERLAPHVLGRGLTFLVHFRFRAIIGRNGRVPKPAADPGDGAPPNVREFEWNDVRFFLAVAREGTLTAAAQRLRTDHTTVGRRVRVLEETLRAKLFDRSTTGCTLTPQGKKFLEAAESMETMAISAQSIIEEADLSMSGTVRIGATDGFGTFFLAPRLGTLQMNHPNLEVHLLAMPRVYSLSKREADIAVGLAQPSEGRLYSRKLTDYHLGVYASQDYLARHPPITSTKDLSKHAFISYIDDMMYAKELNYIPRIDPAISPHLKISNPIGQLKSTVSGYGLCVLPCFIADFEPGLRRVLANEITLLNSFWLIVHSEQRRLTRVQVAADFIREEVNLARNIFLPVHSAS
jgi:DNA-binding transcriptional LysR family regulator